MFFGADHLPYFMKNKEWYYFDEKEYLYKPTEKAPEKAIKSIEKFNSEHTHIDENGVRWTDF